MVKKRSCQAWVDGRRCEKSVHWGRKYCWWHYPKTEAVSTLLVGALLGLLATLLLSDPLARFLSPYWPFHYLDPKPPVVVRVSPDILKSNSVDGGARAFTVMCQDDCAGVDWEECHLDLYCLKENAREPLGGKQDVTKDGFNFTIDRELTPGKYILGITTCDKAKNRSVSDCPFIVPETELLSVTVWYEEYDEAKPKHKTLFRPFVDEHMDQLDPWKLHVYYYGVETKAKNTYCRNIHLTFHNQAVVFCWKETGSMNCTGIGALSVTEAAQRYLGDGVFTSERVLDIEELGPGGFAYFSALVGSYANFDRSPRRVPTVIDVSGTYITEGYGKATAVAVKSSVPVRRLSDNR